MLGRSQTAICRRRPSSKDRLRKKNQCRRISVFRKNIYSNNSKPMASFLKSEIFGKKGNRNVQNIHIFCKIYPRILPLITRLRKGGDVAQFDSPEGSFKHFVSTSIFEGERLSPAMVDKLTSLRGVGKQFWDLTVGLSPRAAEISMIKQPIVFPRQTVLCVIYAPLVWVFDPLTFLIGFPPQYPSSW
ncbi:unnamed protein product, partial [Nesidiocoris tenuis]